ncbi:MAG: ribonuclease E/G [Flavobacteriaceae bacterium]|nr:ribonuclease E/G [Flavobacteriaceae bacterium]
MSKEIIIRSNSTAVDFALLKDGKLIELHKQNDSNKFNVGDIFLAKTKKTISGLNAAFVNVGYEKDAFLHYHDLGPKILSLIKFIKGVSTGKLKNFSLDKFPLESEIDKEGSISDVISPNQTVLVQIIKEPISTKGPRISSELSFAGRFLVLVPFSNRISISQKIESKEEKSRLKRLVQSIKPKGFGVIVRTVAKDQKVASIDKDLKNLYKRWISLCKKIQDSNVPVKVQSELNRSTSILRDYFNDSFTAIHVNQKSMYSEIIEYLKQIAPKKQTIVKLHKSHNPIFEEYGIERQIKTAFGRTVTMSKGAYLIIEHTEALHVIDVNSGNRSTKSKNQEDSALEVNLIAATEIARQLRLRDMGGIIVIDFIDLLNSENRKILFDHFKKEMESDRAKHKILPPSKIGLIEMTRQRVRSEMDIKTIEPNPNENGTVEAPIVLIDKIYGKLEKILSSEKYNNVKIYLHVHPFIAAYLKEGYPSLRTKWFFERKKWIRIVSRDAYTYLHFRFFNKEGKIINA